MKKISLITLGDKKVDTLSLLRKLGTVHIEMEESSGEKLQEIKSKINLLQAALFELGKVKDISQEELSSEQALNKAARMAELGQENKALADEKRKLEAELKLLKSWSGADPHSISELDGMGAQIVLYEMPRAQYDALGDEFKTLCLEKNRSFARFLCLGKPDGLDEYLVTLPSRSCGELSDELERIARREDEINNELSACAAYEGSFKKALAALEKEKEFETYSSGMAKEVVSSPGEKEVSIAHFTGYIEEEKLPQLKQAARENSWGLLCEDPTEDDNVPTKLKNNRFVSLIYPLTDFLGTVPGYFEHDISGWFLGFILIFFGIIFGDGGYGLLICAVCAVPIIKALAAGKAPQPTFLLIGLFGLATIVWGTLTCTWFGLDARNLPRWLQALSVPVISNVYESRLWYPFPSVDAALTTSQNVQILCFTLALIQLAAAHVLGAVRNRKSLKMLGDIGSILQLVGMYYVVLSLVVNARVFALGLVLGGIPIGTLAIGCVGLGFVLSFAFSNYEGSVIKSVVSSLKNIVSVLLGVVNVFSDIVSYIRLWAVGLAGAAISATVNELAGPLFGNLLFMILAIFLLVFGHGLNMILNVLSVIVHGIRLNTLEFSSHLDMSWSGHKFKPFEENFD